MTTLDPNQICSIGFDGSVSGIAQSLACTVQGNLVNAEVQRDCAALILQKEQTCSFLSFWLGILKGTQVPGPYVVSAKNYCKASEKSVKGEDDHDTVFGTLIIVIPPIKTLGGRYTVIRRVTTNQTLVPCSRRATDHLLVIIVPFP